MTTSSPATVLFVPGLRDHVEDHWQTHLAREIAGSKTVPPLIKDRLSLRARVEVLDEALQAIAGDVILAAHSAGVLMIAHWAQNPTRAIRAALLATPADIETPLPEGYPTFQELTQNGWLPIPRAPLPEHAAESEGSVTPSPRGTMAILAFVFAATWFVAGAMAAHMPRLLEIAGASSTAAIAAAALVGPAQVAARLVEFGALRWVHPLVSARIAATLHPLGAALFAIIGAPAAAAFAVFYGAGNGLLTIARGTVPLAVFGPLGYGERTGLLGAPARAAQACAPLLFGLLLDAMGLWVIAVSAALCLAALASISAFSVPSTVTMISPFLPRFRNRSIVLADTR